MKSTLRFLLFLLLLLLYSRQGLYYDEKDAQILCAEHARRH